MNDVYLLDSCIASAYFDKRDKDHQKAATFVNNAVRAKDYIYISCIAVAEIRYGLALYPNLVERHIKEVEQSLAAYKKRKDMNHDTAPYYASIRSDLMKKYCKKRADGMFKRTRPESLIDKTTSQILGIQENDLWLASVAR